MADLYLTEFDTKQIGGEHYRLAQEPPAAAQKVVFTTAAPSAAFNRATTVIRMLSTADCHVTFGAPATAATTADELLKANVEYWRAVQKGHALSVVAA